MTLDDQLSADSLELLHALILVEETVGAVLAEVNFGLESRLDMLHVVVQQWDGNDGRQRGDGTKRRKVRKRKESG